MELASKHLEQVAFNAAAKIEEHIMTVLYKTTQEKNLSEPLQSKTKPFRIAVTFLLFQWYF